MKFKTYSNNFEVTTKINFKDKSFTNIYKKAFMDAQSHWENIVNNFLYEQLLLEKYPTNVRCPKCRGLTYIKPDYSNLTKSPNKVFCRQCSESGKMPIPLSEVL